MVDAYDDDDDARSEGVIDLTESQWGLCRCCGMIFDDHVSDDCPGLSLPRFAALAKVLNTVSDMQTLIDAYVLAERAKCAAIAEKAAHALANDPNRYARTLALKIAADISCRTDGE